MQRKITLLLSVVLLCFCMPVYSQYIPPNIDFETGTLTTGWLYYSGACCPITAAVGPSPLVGRHTRTSGTTVDLYGRFPTVSPYGGLYSLKLGNDMGTAHAEKCRYYLHIPIGTSDYSLVYHYAVVFEEPGHAIADQPRMEIKAYDSATMSIIPCDTFYHIADSALPGFLLSDTIGSSGAPVYYKPWTLGNLKFSGLGGHTVIVDFATGDCSLGGHFGYGYVDITDGFFANVIHTPCTTASVTLSAPPGYSGYLWCDSLTYATIYSATQHAVVIAPGIPTTYAVILTPYSGYGCADTLYTRVFPSVSCSGTPAPGTAFATRAAVCGNPDTLAVSGYSAVCGLAFQWQSSLDNTNWVNIPGAATDIHPYYFLSGAMYYRCMVTCIASGLSAYTSSVFVSMIVTPGLHTWINPPSIICHGASFYVSTCGSSASYNVTTWYGDGTSDNTLLTSSGVPHASIIHNYGFPGTYTIKQILYDGSSPVDSVVFSYEYLYCSTLPVKLFWDSNSDCIFNTGDVHFFNPVNTEVDSNGTAIDTISSLSGFYYRSFGPPGTIYTFTALPDAYVAATCPVGGMLRDTIVPTVNLYQEKEIGFNCSTTASFDLRASSSVRCGIHRSDGVILVSFTGCLPTITTLKMTFSPKYRFAVSIPSPSSVVGNEVTWNLGALAPTDTAPRTIYYLLSASPYLPIGDTINTVFTVTPIVGDGDVSNNVIIRNDTVKSGYDPNYKEVTPQGYISSGTQLQYAIHFENTGNDTAFNIHIMDTLSPYLDARSLEMVAASAEMNLAVFNVGGQNIVKFDFPHINLLDSSHHGLCDGMVVFKINTKTGLPFGTVIPNRAGIYFDDNEVVMTEAVNNIIPFPSSVDPVIKTNKVELFPNPANDELTIKMDKDAYSSFVITNQVGQELIQQQISNAQTRVNIKSLPAGLYYITLKGENGTRVQKFVKI